MATTVLITKVLFLQIVTSMFRAVLKPAGLSVAALIVAEVVVLEEAMSRATTSQKGTPTRLRHQIDQALNGTSRKAPLNLPANEVSLPLVRESTCSSTVTLI